MRPSRSRPSFVGNSIAREAESGRRRLAVNPIRAIGPRGGNPTYALGVDETPATFERAVAELGKQLVDSKLKEGIKPLPAQQLSIFPKRHAGTCM